MRATRGRVLVGAVSAIVIATVIARVAPAGAAEASKPETPAERGLRLLRTEPYAPADVLEEHFDRLWEVWPEPLRKQAVEATPEERRTMAFSRYGLIEDPDDPDGPPIGVVEDGQGGWVMNCLACHQGKVAGRVIWGVGNSHFAFQTLVQDVAKIRKVAGDKDAPGASVGSFVPLGLSNGTTNAQVFSIVLTALRDEDLNRREVPKIPRFKNHDLDAPPFWNVKRKKNLYIDGFVPKTHRVIMQFALVPSNDGESFKKREEGFRDILAWIESLEAPEYPWDVDEDLAAQGQKAFNRACADCHGTYGPGGTYPEKRVPIDTVGTDSTRLTGMPAEHRRFYRESWFGEYGQLEVVEEPEGYVAPPLDGVWASAPYFHNGSVPTLWHVLHPGQRPTVWRRTENGYDRQRVGLEITELEAIPPGAKKIEAKRSYFDTSITGKSAAGHDFPEELDEDEKRAVLEYLKTL
ncbi:MAG: cytochrome c [Planctomycetota bacterium]|nr:MAG: cytochrome c [Planctomycetota bacterium]